MFFTVARRRLLSAISCFALIGGSHVFAQGDKAERTEAVASRAPPHFLVLRISSEMLNSLVDTAIDMQTPVSEVILGVPVGGVAHVTGQPQVVLTPSPDQATFQVVVKGTAHSRSTGNAGPVTVHSHSITRFTATSTVAFEPSRGFFAGPPLVHARTQVITDDLEPSRRGPIGRIIERRAWKQVAAQKPQVTEIVQQRAAARISAAFERHLESRLARLNRAMEFRTLVANRCQPEAGTPQVHCCTTTQHVEIADTFATDQTTITLPVLGSASTVNAPLEIWIHNRVLPAGTRTALKCAISGLDQNAFVNALVLLLRSPGKEATAALTTLFSDRKVNLQSLSNWTVVELDSGRAGSTTVARRLNP